MRDFAYVQDQPLLLDHKLNSGATIIRGDDGSTLIQETWLEPAAMDWLRKCEFWEDEKNTFASLELSWDQTPQQNINKERVCSEDVGGKKVKLQIAGNDGGFVKPASRAINGMTLKHELPLERLRKFLRELTRQRSKQSRVSSAQNWRIGSPLHCL